MIDHLSGEPIVIRGSLGTECFQVDTSDTRKKEASPSRELLSLYVFLMADPQIQVTIFLQMSWSEQVEYKDNLALCPYPLATMPGCAVSPTMRRLQMQRPYTLFLLH